jgi:hypothetical protein
MFDSYNGGRPVNYYYDSLDKSFIRLLSLVGDDD